VVCFIVETLPQFCDCHKAALSKGIPMNKASIAVLAAALIFATGTVGAQQPPAQQERSNKGGEVRGQERADQVRQSKDRKPANANEKKNNAKPDKK
jgi:hypothetical protein